MLVLIVTHGSKRVWLLIQKQTSMGCYTHRATSLVPRPLRAQLSSLAGCGGLGARLGSAHAPLCTLINIRSEYIISACSGFASLVPRPHLSRGKRSGEPSRISWAYYRNVVRTNEIGILSIITWHTLYWHAAMCEGARLFSSFSFWLDKRMLRMLWRQSEMICTRLC